MKFKPVFVGDMSGSVGALTASRGRAGPYFKLKGFPVNPNSPAQVAVRVAFGQLSTLWASLTPDQRLAWATYAENVPVTGGDGDPLTLTGQTMYIRSNTVRLQAQLARIDDAPTLFSLATLSAIRIAPSAATGAINITYNDVDDKWDKLDGGLLAVYVSRQQSPTINFFRNPYRFAGAILGNTITPPPSPDSTIASQFAMTEGNTIFTRFVASDPDGRLSQSQSLGPDEILA